MKQPQKASSRSLTRMAATARVVVTALVVVGGGRASAASPAAEAAYKDMQSTLGVVPEFFKEYPEDAIGPAWAEMKAVQLNPNTALTPKQKELVGLAVAAQIPCTYCVYFHTEVAKALGATDDELKHAIAEAALSRHWSAIVNGADQNEAAFRAEAKRMADAMRKRATTPAQRAAAPVLVDADTVSRDIERTFGFVPSFMKLLPEEAMAAAWNEMKMIEQNPTAPLDGKTLSAVALGVSAQVPCKYCVIFDREFARVNGLGEREMKEAVAVAGIVRHWSTFLNGAQIDQQRFRTDVDRIVAHMQRSDEPGRGR